MMSIRNKLLSYLQVNAGLNNESNRVSWTKRYPSRSNRIFHQEMNTLMKCYVLDGLLSFSVSNYAAC